MKHRFAVAAVVALLAHACSDTPAAPSEVIGGTWRLMSWSPASGPSVVVDSPDRYTVRFRADGRLEIKSDCNSCGSSYRLSGSALAVSEIACTRAFCSPPSLDPGFAEAVGRAHIVTIREDTLILHGDHGTLQFKP